MTVSLKHLIGRGITYWIFFRSSNEKSLLDHGLNVGVACLLCKGVSRFEEYVL
ncbi:hypothetical protein VP01_5403g1 [Puccinia sorghi]|uniref:Uncharacterized protein n=1 Tax=Puccinia sorghi TaxID=27349 RepID=A0A0L6UJS7_9BASI|nr:hypothetical protein VP01_5403g1 [Puccinia sorghi]